MKGETVDELVGFVRAMRENAKPMPCQSVRLVDTCGTGGDKKGTFNVSTLAALAASGAGCKVAKHGNRSVTSRCGSADLLEALGVKVDAPSAVIARCIDSLGIGFMFAPAFHPATKHAVLPRREIGIKTLFNLIGPLSNPAKAKRQIVGVFAPEWTEKLAEALGRLGSEHVLVVWGEDGMDEITLAGRTKVSELRNGKIATRWIQPEDFGYNRIEPNAVRGGDAKENARIAVDVLTGKPGPARHMTALNAGAAIYAAGVAVSIFEGARLAEESIDSGRALEKLEALKRMTNEAVSE
jgi:anthranilate phosphoribosyltransferase